MFDPFTPQVSSFFKACGPFFFPLSHRLPLAPPTGPWYFPSLRRGREDGIPAADWTTPVFPTSHGINGTRGGSGRSQNRSGRMEDGRSAARTGSPVQAAEMFDVFEMIRRSVRYLRGPGAAGNVAPGASLLSFLQKAITIIDCNNECRNNPNQPELGVIYEQACHIHPC